jgi:hypothetical protein
MKIDHSEKGLATLTAMNTSPSDWGLTEIKWEKRRVAREVWVICDLCAGSGRIGTVDGKTVNGCEAWNRQASKTIRTCTACPQVSFTRKGREWFRENEDTKVWYGTRGDHHGAASSNNYSFMNGLVLKTVTVEREFGIPQWAKGTRFDSRFEEHYDTCSLCAKVIPSRRFVPVTGKFAGVIHGMWVGEDCARKFFMVKNFKKDQIVEREEVA